LSISFEGQVHETNYVIQLVGKQKNRYMPPCIGILLTHDLTSVVNDKAVYVILHYVF